MRHLIRWAALSLLVVGMQASGLRAAAAPKWTQLRTENFLFIGDASEGEIRRTAQRLEQFREALLKVLPGTNVAAHIPTVVIVFATDRSMTPVKPLFRGRPVELAGMFQDGRDVNYLVVNAEYLDRSMQSIYHEYTHFLVSENQGEVPVWVNEGLAELYSLAQQDGGKSVLIGRAPFSHVTTLQSNTMLPVKELMAVDHSASIYNEGNRRGVLYAQSWALVHYLTLGNGRRAVQFRNFLAAMRSGTPDEEAFASAFSDAELLDKELYDYTRRFAFPAVQIQLSGKSAASMPRGEALDDNEADTYVADLQARIDRVEDARARVAAIQKRDPKMGRAFMVLGTIDLREKRVSDAVANLEKAAALAPDDFIVQSTYVRSLVVRMSELTDDEAAAAELLARARPAVARATTLNPQSAEAERMRGYLEIAGGGDLAVAVAALIRAIQLDPRQEEYRILLAEALIRQGEYDKATSLLGPLMGGGRTKEIRAEARRVLGNLADMRVARAARSTAMTPTRPVDSSSSNASESTTAPTSAATPAGNRSDATRAGVVYRAVRAGEQRVLGTFDAVDCARERIVLHVTSNGRSLALRAARFADVDFISYRPDAPKFSCGTQQSRDRVYATYRPDTSTPGVDGVAVAIELLPDDFVPPKPLH